MTIILADDDSEEHLIFQEALNILSHDINFVTFRDGKYLLDHLTTSFFLPDLIFVDINMPLMNGLDTLKQIKINDKWKHIPVIMYSTTAHKNDIHKAYKQGADLYFRKEISITKLAEKLDSIIDILKDKQPLAESIPEGSVY